MDANFTKTAYAIIDKPNGRNIQKAVASTFVGDMFVTTGFNKTIFAVRQTDKDKIDAYKEWNSFRQTSGGLEMPWYRDRPALLTIRAKKQYVLTLAAANDSMYMLSVPNDRVKGQILIKVNNKDRLLSSETPLSSALELKDSMDIKDYYFTAGSISEGVFYAYSKNYNTLVLIDIATAKIIDAYAMPKMGEISALAIKNDSIFALTHDGDKVVIVQIKKPE
ncbi:hypothetical protein LMG7974_01159 [Campylobacter majalis]|uniref:Uncharacterized protein n=1 Tax=Campylobacter majalis TaxID=2790656 RepID=A0ABN7K8Q4_9BACT|nr:hypothetical protein [Campylobacter majalis]CAD7288800.1 hypothetical protein LMG7974_01159 [Campylobacter majalis]